MDGWLNAIKFNVLKHKKNLSEKQENFIFELLMQRGGSPLEIVSGLNPEALTPGICELAYLRESSDNLDEVINRTPKHCMQKMNSFEFCHRAIKLDYHNFLNMNLKNFTDFEERNLLILDFEDSLLEKTEYAKQNKLDTPEVVEQIKLYQNYQPLFIEAKHYLKLDVESNQTLHVETKEEKEMDNVENNERKDDDTNMDME